MSGPRAKATATTLLDGTVVVIGGSNGINDLVSAEFFDPTANNFNDAGRLGTARSKHSAFLLPNNNEVLVVGGQSAGTDLASAELYIPWQKAFQVTGAMATPRSDATGAALTKVDGRLLSAGGSSASAELYGFATVKTDAADYPPGTTVTITGTGWQPGETSNLEPRLSRIERHSMRPANGKKPVHHDEAALESQQVQKRTQDMQSALLILSVALGWQAFSQQWPPRKIVLKVDIAHPLIIVSVQGTHLSKVEVWAIPKDTRSAEYMLGNANRFNDPSWGRPETWVFPIPSKPLSISHVFAEAFDMQGKVVGKKFVSSHDANELHDALWGSEPESK